MNLKNQIATRLAATPDSRTEQPEVEQTSGTWSHRADLDSWQDDFASDFEETD